MYNIKNTWKGIKSMIIFKISIKKLLKMVQPALTK